MKDTFYDDIDEDVVVIVDEHDLEEEQYENPLLEQYLLGNKEIKKPKFDKEDEEIPRIENNNIDILSKYNLDSSIDENYIDKEDINTIEEYDNPLLEQYLLGKKEIKKPKFDEEDEEISRIENNDIDILSKYNLDSSVDEVYKETTQNNDIENILADNYIDYDDISIFENEENTELNIEENKELDNKENIGFIPPVDLSLLNKEEETVEEVEDFKVEDKDEDEIVINNSKKKLTFNRIFISILLLTMLFAISLVGALYLYNSSPKTVVKKSIDHIISYKNYFNKPFTLSEGKEKSLNGNMKFSINENYKKIYSPDESEYKFYDKLNKMEIKYDLQKSSEKIQYDFNLSAGADNMNILLTANKNNGYIFLKDVYEKYIEIDGLNEAINAENNLDIEDYDYFYNFCYNSFFRNLNKNKYISEKGTLKIDGSNLNIRKTTIKLSEKDIYEIINVILDDIANDTKANVFVKKITGEDASKLEKMKYDEKNETPSDYEYIVYSKGLLGDIVGIDFNVTSKYKSYNYNWDNLKDNDYKSNNYKINEKTTKYQYRNEEKPVLSIYEDDEFISKLEIQKNKKDTIVFNLFDENNKESGKITIKNTKSKFSINYIESSDVQEAEYDLIFNIKENKAYEDYTINFEGKFEVKDVYYDTDPTNFKINAVFNIKNGLTTSIKDVKESVKLDNLTDDEKEKISNNLLEKFYKLLGYDYDPDYADDELPSLLNFQK
ncbi:MAG: hypothetical protein PUA68_04545 [Bacilli bacterium]|nr:hypothetical protein [Bacilli bacterium]